MPVGHPPKLKQDETTLKTLEGLGMIHASLREAAAVLGVKHQSLVAFFKRWPEGEEAFEFGKEKGRANLRRLQFHLAQKNAAMAIFLGKNMLGQADRQEVTGSDGGPVKMIVEWQKGE